MIIDFGKINFKEIEEPPMSPRDIFMSLPNKDARYNYPRDVQTEVWNKWFEVRDQCKDSIIKMNTGSGKTVVGLLILKSCLTEKKGPAVYVAPDPYLVKQVMEEASRLGISVTEDEDSGDFRGGKSILVINIHKLINGKTVFGMRETGNVPIGSIIIDDVHACLNVTEEQFTIKIMRDNIKYHKLFKIFDKELEKQSANKYLDICDSIPHTNMLVPFWVWQNNISEITKIFHEGKDDEDIRFTFPLLADSLELCNCIVSTEQIEITPKSIPIHKILNFHNAKRRIFMSATLADDSPFVSHFNIDMSKNISIISPHKADDVGERLIIAPEHINPNIDENGLKIKFKELSEIHNVVIIVPSKYRAAYWSDVADVIIDSSNIEDEVEKLKLGHVGLVVFINKYDGIDLPDTACRILVIDGLAEIKSGYDKLEQSIASNNERIQNNFVQRIEQGMGRGIRSNQDYCVIFLLGKNLTNLLFCENALDKFSIATKMQINISKQICDQLKGASLDDIIGVTDYCLKRNIDWVENSKKALLNLEYPKDINVDKTILAYRQAFDNSEAKNYSEAVRVLEEVANKSKEDSVKGWLKQQVAEYINFTDPVKAQQVLKSALNYNVRILKPIEGIQFDKIVKEFNGQGKQLLDFIENNCLDENKYIIKINSILENLIFKPDTASTFEESFKLLAFYLGFSAYRPENDYGRGPDVLWQVGELNFLIIECKNGVTNKIICKHDCNQLNGSINWFKQYYKLNNTNYKPIMIHLGNEFEYACSPDRDIRIINSEKLELLKSNVQKFSVSLANPENFKSVPNINKLLKQFKLDEASLIDEYTVGYKIKNIISSI